MLETIIIILIILWLLGFIGPWRRGGNWIHLLLVVILILVLLRYL